MVVLEFSKKPEANSNKKNFKIVLVTEKCVKFGNNI